MKSICFFCSYFKNNTIPYYVKFYLTELKNHFTDLYLLTDIKKLDERSINFLIENKIELKQYKNEGFDFGMWHKVLQEINIDKYDRIGLINDSCILFKDLNKFFDWLQHQQFDYSGLVLSGKISLHVQSYFLIINKNAINAVKRYFKLTGIPLEYSTVIEKYEIGLSKYLLNENFKIGGLFDYSLEKNKNPSYVLAMKLIADGSPMIKKKLISRQYRWGDYLTWFRNNSTIDHKLYLKKITEYNDINNIINFNTVIKEGGYETNTNDIFLYKVLLFQYKIFSRIKFFKCIFHHLIKLKRKINNQD